MFIGLSEVSSKFMFMFIGLSEVLSKFMFIGLYELLIEF